MGNLITTTEDNNLVESFINRGLSENSATTYATAVKQYENYISDNDLEPGINSIRNWLRTFSNPKTFNGKLQAVKEYYFHLFKNLSVEKRLEIREGFDTIKREKPKTAVLEDDYLTIEDVKILTTIGPVKAFKTDERAEKIRLIIWALFWTGCRISELIDIELEKCNPNGKVSITVKGKGSKERRVYMPKDLYHKIQEIFKGKKYLFETHKGTQLDRRNVTNDIKKLGWEKLNKSISAHGLRHGKAMHLKDVLGLSADQVAKALGHSSVVTTLQYYFHGTPTADNQGIPEEQGIY